MNDETVRRLKKERREQPRRDPAADGAAAARREANGLHRDQLENLAREFGGRYGDRPHIPYSELGRGYEVYRALFGEPEPDGGGLFTSPVPPAVMDYWAAVLGDAGRGYERACDPDFARAFVGTLVARLEAVEASGEDRGG